MNEWYRSSKVPANQFFAISPRTWIRCTVLPAMLNTTFQPAFSPWSGYPFMVAGVTAPSQSIPPRLFWPGLLQRIIRAIPISIVSRQSDVHKCLPQTIQSRPKRDLRPSGLGPEVLVGLSYARRAIESNPGLANGNFDSQQGSKPPFQAMFQ